MAMSPKKSKPSTSTSRGSVSAEHPPLWVMLKAAITNLKDRKGSSRQAIMKYVQSNYKVQMTGKFKSAMKRCVNKGVSEGKLVKTKGSFKLSSEEKSAKKPKSPGVTKTKRAAVSGGVSTNPKSAKPKTTAKKPKTKAAKPTSVMTGGAAGASGGTMSKKVKKTTVHKTKRAPKAKAAAKK